MLLTPSITVKNTFSGHESFHCRLLWLKKGYDFIQNGHSFSASDAVVTLGVGKNMVTAIKFWLKAFDIIGLDEQPTDFAHFLFKDHTGFDPYLEDDQSLWLLHYKLVKTNFASIYALIFNEFRKEKIQFSKENFQAFISRKLETSNIKTVGDDFDVFKKMYLNKSEDNKLTEDSFLGLLSELQLLKFKQKGIYYINNAERPTLTPQVFLYSILDNEQFGSSISLHALENDENSPGAIFALSRHALLELIEQIAEKDWITYSDQAGIKELQFKHKPESPFTLFKRSEA
ncbi:DUF4007 domain-containing protein [Mucilaginibacter galii]|uniref:DUF4007 domain-containing protein n=1 Tax=Mucilaginibacter galii TaxID=2005073 RepID=A0A917J9X0_9SPHI|nr:DUF4007 family protein [Mucilaginibacter galii]GGI50802.1 hypothetical protein GCM10011425_20140 [Mucilaginibacter galii]